MVFWKVYAMMHGQKNIKLIVSWRRVQSPSLLSMKFPWPLCAMVNKDIWGLDVFFLNIRPKSMILGLPLWTWRLTVNDKVKSWRSWRTTVDVACIKQCVAHAGDVWLVQVMCGTCRWCVAHTGNVWLLQVMCGSCRWCVAHAGDVWLMQVMCGSCRWCVARAGDVWLMQVTCAPERCMFLEWCIVNP